MMPPWGPFFLRVLDARGPDAVGEAAVDAMRRYPDEAPFIMPAAKLAIDIWEVERVLDALRRFSRQKPKDHTND